MQTLGSNSGITSASRGRRGGFTLVELAVIALVIGLLVAIVLPWLAKSRQRARRIGCVSHLKQIGLAFRVFANDYGDRYPMAIPGTPASATNLSAGDQVAAIFRTLSNELSTPFVLVCPDDRRPPATGFSALKPTHLSYFVGLDTDETQPQLLLSGDANLALGGVAIGNQFLVVTSNSNLSWTPGRHGTNSGNVALADGSVQQFSPARLKQHLAESSADQTNRLAIP